MKILSCESEIDKSSKGKKNSQTLVTKLMILWIILFGPPLDSAAMEQVTVKFAGQFSFVRRQFSKSFEKVTKTYEIT